MNWLPTLPTDSLHKYLALNGLWFVYGILALLAFLNYQNFEHEEFNKKQSWLLSKQESVRKFKARAESIKKREFSENTIPGISNKLKPKEEIILLRNAISLNENDIEALTQDAKKQPNSLFPLVAYFHIEQLLVVFFGAGIFLASWGFSNWVKLQRISDEMQKHDLELKRLQILEAKRARFKRRT